MNKILTIIKTISFFCAIPNESELVVDFVEMSYTVTEGGGPLYMYVELIEGAIERAFPSTVEVEFTTLDLSTEGSYRKVLYRFSDTYIPNKHCMHAALMGYLKRGSTS